MNKNITKETSLESNKQEQKRNSLKDEKGQVERSIKSRKQKFYTTLMFLLNKHTPRLLLYTNKIFNATGLKRRVAHVL